MLGSCVDVYNKLLLADADEAMAMVTDDNAIYHFGSQFAAQLAQGLADNWSQVLAES